MPGSEMSVGGKPSMQAGRRGDEELPELLSLIARLGTQGEEQQEDAVRLQLNTKIKAFFYKFQHMEEKISSLENLVDLKETQLAVLPQVKTKNYQMLNIQQKGQNIQNI